MDKKDEMKPEFPCQGCSGFFQGAYNGRCIAVEKREIMGLAASVAGQETIGNIIRNNTRLSLA